MKTLPLFFAGLLSAGFVSAQVCALGKAHSNLGFTVARLAVQDADGAFKDFTLTLNAAKDASDLQITLTANIAGIDTQNEKRDNDLKGRGNSYESKDALALHGVAKPPVLKGELKGEDPFAKKAMDGFKACGKAKRADFNIGNSTPAAIVGNEAEIKANITIIKS